ncbi:asparagine synthase (glutamine-hydrolyzing) [Chengkuizengella sp. SCS-71B]|uniref:asparagine synthase (glutamine-hydrolyzing) n=1 Tax=Chengkuizengella sp. SCS-71B TaxID=3115290 RepID=UPI0032C23F9B
MCGITGWINWNDDLTKYPTILEDMTKTLATRGPDASGTWMSPHCSLGHRRLSVIDPENGAQPMWRKYDYQTFVIVYNGEIYNAFELKEELINRGHTFQTNCDTEVVLISYIEWGAKCVERLNGIFAFAIWNDLQEKLFIARDRVGVKPLFFSNHNSTFLFGSEPKAILENPTFKPEIGAEGLAEIFVIGPARTPGHGIYNNMEELKPGYCLELDKNGLKKYPYWKLESHPHFENEDQTAQTIKDLLIDTVERQLVSDVPVCTLLSGGLDSSALTAIAVNYYNKTKQGTVNTFSVDYVDNDIHFKENDFQPNSDQPWIQRMSSILNTNHKNIQFDTPELVESLKAVVDARDTPGMADVDASLYLFCREIKKQATVAISGEAADEIFGGYPWFHREDSLNANTFPWSLTLNKRLEILSDELKEWIRPEQYVEDRYAQAIGEVPHLKGETAEQKQMRQMSYLNITRFMPTLLDRKDRMSMRVGLEVRVPYCDHRLIDYVWNIPWEIKIAGNREKGILRKALKGILPEDVIQRKKSPYPKTHNPNYTEAVKKWVLEILDDPSSPLQSLINVKKIKEIANSDVKSYHFPWFGQLMSGPQLFAYLAQVDLWLRKYNISIK